MNINLFPPALIFFTDNLPDGVGGRANGPVVRIKTKYERDFGMIEHELEHVRQWWVTLGLHPFLYACSKTYRLWSEASAYAKQVGMFDANREITRLDVVVERFARVGYGLNLTKEQIEKQILKRLG